MEQESDQELAARRFEREQRLLEIAAEIDKIRDRLGKPVDEGIKDTLTALLAQGFETSGSCEGHDDQGRAVALPWVDIETAEPTDWKTNREARNVWVTKNQEQAGRIQRLLDEWYEQLEKAGAVIDPQSHLHLKPRGILGAMRLEPATPVEAITHGVETPYQLSGPYRAEMQKFSEYLREKFLNQE